jgi:tRNA A-37 threonylcarbamoyl transferase component Bud32
MLAAVGSDARRTDPVLAEGTRIGDFLLRGLLGEGAMGQVYLAEDTTLGRRVALKLLRSSVLQHNGSKRFLDEARATASFNHPHIVTLYAVGEYEGRPYLALEYVDGESLRALLAAGPLPVYEALSCCLAVADAIAEAHRRGLVHADLKPDNIVVASDGRVRVVDFGLARLARGATDAASGTPAYMAPERWRGAPPTGAIDVWALGVTLHELITGTRPIPDAALLHVAFVAETLAIPGLPAAPWARLVRDCLALDPAARPTAEVLVRRLSGLLDEHAEPIDGNAIRPHRAGMHAQHLMTELAPDEVHLVRGILLALVGPGGARRPYLRSELLGAAPAGARGAVEQLIDRLVARGLIVVTRGERHDPTLELAYEALTSAWPHLARWLDDARMRPLRLAFSARNAGPPGDAWLVPVVERMVRRAFHDHRGRRFHVVERGDDATWIELVLARANDQIRIDALSAADARVLASAEASSVSGAVHALAGTLGGKLGAGLDPAGPDPDELEEMHCIGATSVELFRRYRCVLHAHFATSLPDLSALSAAARRLIADDPTWAHPYVLLALIEGIVTDAARHTLTVARAVASAARDRLGTQLIHAMELASRGDYESAFQIAEETFRQNEGDLFAGVLLANWSMLARRSEEGLAIARRLHTKYPELSFGMDLAAWLRWEARDDDVNRLIREWVEAAPDNLPARVELVRIAANLGRLDEAQAQAREVIAIHGGCDDALPDLFEAFIALDRISDGRAVADRMLAGSPAIRAYGRYRVAMTSVLEGRFAAAYDAVRRAITEHRAFGMRSELTQCLELARSIAPLVADVQAARRYTEELATAFATMIGDAGVAAALRFELALLEHRGTAPSIDDHLAGLDEGPMRDVARRRMLRAAALAGHGSPHTAVAAGFSATEENTASLVTFGLCARNVRELALARWSFERASRQWTSLTNNQCSSYHAVLARFHLAGVLDELGEHAAAHAAYEAFLRCWSNADRPVPEVAIARRTLARTDRAVPMG